MLLQICGLKNSKLNSCKIINNQNLIPSLEKLFGNEFVLFAAPEDGEIFLKYLNKSFKDLYPELDSCNGTFSKIKSRFQFQVSPFLNSRV
jgi:hypothetical protein